MHLLFAVLLIVASQGTSTQPQASACTSPAAPGDVATSQLCVAEQAMQAGNAAPKGTRERTRQFEAAAEAFRRAIGLSSSAETKVRALSVLVTLYDADHLNALTEQEVVLREWIAAAPDDLKPMFRLAKLQEEWGQIEVAETTLLDARHRQPENEEPNKMLAQFYARRVTALHTLNSPTAADAAGTPGMPDASGVYRIGGALAAPKRSDVPQYPPEAAAAGIAGPVLAEIVIDPSGNVADARVVRSIPLLDEAALAAVRGWRFTPTVVNGQPVPVRMVITVNFSTQQQR